jgi:hypothetical protein
MRISVFSFPRVEMQKAGDEEAMGSGVMRGRQEGDACQGKEPGSGRPGRWRLCQAREAFSYSIASYLLYDSWIPSI